MTLADKLTQSYAMQVAQDGALDLFEPAVEVLLAPYYDAVRQAVGTSTTRDVYAAKFPEYFTPRQSSVFLRSGSDSVAVADQTANLPLALMSDCGRPLVTWGIPRPCLRLLGRRGTFGIQFPQLFVGDLVWLFYHERMGIHRMMGALLDDFVSRGKHPLRPSSLEGLMLEQWCRSIKSGLCSTSRERQTTYLQILDWGMEPRLDLPEVPKNKAFNELFHRLIFLVLGYYNEKRLAVAIQNTTVAGAPSRATLTSIRDAITQLRKAFDLFKYGRNHTHTLSGIVATFSGLALLMRLRNQLGIPEPFDTPDELIPAIYKLLVGDARPISGNRYIAHRDCAEAGRAILLDVQGFDFDAAGLDDQDLEDWLKEPKVETAFELYRSSYRVLTGSDLGTPTAPVEQAVV